MRVFGYGSLVNLGTHSHVSAGPVRLDGWRRAWVHTDLRPIAFLTALPGEGSIEGLALDIAPEDRAGLAAREAAYDAVPDGALTVFTIPVVRQSRLAELHPILLSYLDVVVQGYLTHFGTEGVARFFETTGGWDAPVLDDRTAPRYPRAMALDPQERALTDRHLDALGVRRLRP